MGLTLSYGYSEYADELIVQTTRVEKPVIVRGGAAAQRMALSSGSGSGSKAFSTKARSKGVSVFGMVTEQAT